MASVEDTPLSAAIPGRHRPAGGTPRIGLIPGEGVGPELTEAARKVLATLAAGTGIPLDLRDGPPATASATRDGHPTPAVDEFCRATFAAGGAVLCGPHGGRWVYSLRRRFDLFCKLSPLSSALGADPDGAFDIIVAREQVGGVYQGRWSEFDERSGGYVAEQSFSYTRRDVERILAVGINLARARSGRMAVIVKRGGIPSISRLWEDTAEARCAACPEPPALEVLDFDFAAYRLVADPASFDVIVTPNMIGDVISDLGGVLLGSRGLCFGANFDAAGGAVYQTNHGAAHDLSGSGRVNPGAHLLAAAMMLRESFGLTREAARLERAVIAAVRGGSPTEDVSLNGAGCSTDEFISSVCAELRSPSGTDIRV